MFSFFFIHIEHNFPRSFASTNISIELVFQKKSHKFKVVIIPRLQRDHKHSRNRETIDIVNKLLKSQCLNNGFHFLEFKSNWLNNNDSLAMELFYDDYLHLLRKGNELLPKEFIDFYYHSKYAVAYSKPSYIDITFFSLNYADFPPNYADFQLMHIGLIEFLEGKQILYSRQFGFRKGFSTNHAISTLLESIQKALDDGQFVCGIFIDLEKAFDTVSHDILLEKLNHYGIEVLQIIVSGPI